MDKGWTESKKYDKICIRNAVVVKFTNATKKENKHGKEDLLSGTGVNYIGDIMKITYINHSGFLIETKDCYYIFDYYKGELPLLDKKKESNCFCQSFS